MPYAPDGLAALVLHPLSRCHSGSSAAISPTENPNDPNMLQATRRFPVYAEQPAAGTTGATGLAAVVIGAAFVVGATGDGAGAGADVVGAGEAGAGESVAVGRAR